MKIIIADAKTLKYHDYQITGNTPLFINKSNDLLSLLTNLDERQIHDLMKVSFKQAKLITKYYQNQNTYPAISLFAGTVYKELKLAKYQQNQWNYLEKYLLINSPLYGLCRYNDLIRYHRLEITHKIEGLSLSLYQYWQKEITEYLKDEDTLISLSTKEYEKMLPQSKLIHIDFREIKGDKIYRPAIYLKQARGKMLQQMVTKNITNLADLKQIVIDDYHFKPELSTKQKLVFVRNKKIQFTHL